MIGRRLILGSGGAASAALGALLVQVNATKWEGRVARVLAIHAINSPVDRGPTPRLGRTR